MAFSGIEASLFPFTRWENEPDGFSVEICRHVIKAIEEKLGKKLARNRSNDANSRIMMVKTGMADMECGDDQHGWPLAAGCVLDHLLCFRGKSDGAGRLGR
jgi:hypothetical protein